MIKALVIRFQQLIESIANGGITFALGKAFFINKMAIPVVKNLEKPSVWSDREVKQELFLIEITRQTLPQLQYFYQVKSRSLKMQHNVDKGFRAFAAVSGKTIVGDIWYTTSETTRHSHLHEDMDLLFVTPGPKDVYMFDMFVDPIHRGNSTALFLMKNALFQLAVKGYEKVFGYVDAKNIPAIWIHRVLNFKELDRVLISRYFIKRISHKLVIA
jgi:hypothetical protein